MRHAVRFALAAQVLLSASAEAQERVRTFVLRSAGDTIAVEQVRRSPGRLEGELLFRTGNQRWHYVAATGADGLIRSLDNEFRFASDPSAGPARQSAHLEFLGDSVIVTLLPPATGIQRFGSTRGALPFINPSFGLLEQAMVRARQQGRDSLNLPFFALSGGQTFAVQVRVRPDTVLMSLNGVATLLFPGNDGLIRGGAVPGQGLTLSISEGSPAGALAATRPDYSAPPEAPYRAIDVTIPTPMGHTLAGTLTVPTGAGRVAAIVTITGSGLQDRDETIPLVKGYKPFREIADALGRRGIAVLRMDDRGFGESGGNPANATGADFARDIEAALAFLRARPDIDSHRLGLLGHSEGGTIAPMIAAGDSALRGIILMAGTAWTMRRVLTWQNQDLLDHQPGLSARARDSILTTVVPRGIDSLARAQPWIGFWVDYDPLATARRVHQPVLILQGGTDRQVTPDQAPALEEAFKAGGNRDVTLRLFPETNHLFLADPDGYPARYGTLTTSRMRPEVLTAIVEWATRHFR